MVGSIGTSCRVSGRGLLLESKVSRLRAIAPIWYVAAAIALGAAAFLLFLRDAYNHTSEAEVINAPGDAKLYWTCPYWAFRTQGPQQYGLFSIEGRLVPDPGTVRPRNAGVTPTPDASGFIPDTPSPGFRTASPRSDGVNFDDVSKRFNRLSEGRLMGHLSRATSASVAKSCMTIARTKH
jgi:hypothetical protein